MAVVADGKIAVRGSALQQLAFVLKASRPGFWSTSIWSYLLTVAQQPVLDTGIFWLGVVYFSFPFGLLLYGWNDLGDRATDRINPRKGNYLYGARGNDTQLASLPLLVGLVQIPFLVVFSVRIGILPVLLWFAALLMVNHLYNNSPFRFIGTLLTRGLMVFSPSQNRFSFFGRSD